MPVYQQSGSTIGNLLRAIQEDKSVSPLGAPPQSDTASPIRGLVQQPLLQSEAPDSARAAVIRPELSLGQETAGVVPPQGPIAPTAAGAVVAPVAPPVRDVSPSSGLPVAEFNAGHPAPAGKPGNSSSPMPVSSPTPAKVSFPTLATKITSAPKAQVLGASTKASVPVPKPTPAPSQPKPSNNAPKPSSVGQFIVDIFKGIGTKLNPFKTGKALA